MAATVVLVAGALYFGVGPGAAPSLTDTQQLSSNQSANATTTPPVARDSSVTAQPNTSAVKPAGGAASAPSAALLSNRDQKATPRNELATPETSVKQAASSEPRQGANRGAAAGDTTRTPASPRDTTPPAASAPPIAPTTPSAPPTLAASEVATELAGIRALVVPDAPAASLANAVNKVNAILPRISERSDSIRLLYYRAQAHALQEDPGNACKTLSAALGLATKGSSLETTLARTSASLNCP